jgi:hypothetical protein
MTLPKLIKIEDLKEFADLVSGKYFYIIETSGSREYVIQIEEDKSTEYIFIVPWEVANHVIFKIIGSIDKTKKYRAFFLDNVLIIYESEYYEKEFEDIIKNSIELKEENKKIEDLFNQLRSVMAKGIESISIETEKENTKQETGKSIIEIEKVEDKETDLDQFYNIVEEVYKEADIEKRYKRIKLYETEKKVEEKEEEYGLKDEDDNEGDDDE